MSSFMKGNPLLKERKNNVESKKRREEIIVNIKDMVLKKRLILVTKSIFPVMKRMKECEDKEEAESI